MMICRSNGHDEICRVFYPITNLNSVSPPCITCLREATAFEVIVILSFDESKGIMKMFHEI
jgi:hypothetical protein